MRLFIFVSGNFILTAVAFMKVVYMKKMWSNANIDNSIQNDFTSQNFPSGIVMPGKGPAGLSPNYPYPTEVYLNYL